MEQSLYVFNSLTRRKERFEPIHPPLVGLYVCGPTVYNEVHLGNLRTFTSFDLIYRYLKYSGYTVRYVRNITDVGHLENDADEGEDKISVRAKLEKLEPMEIVQKYSNGFRDVMRIFRNLPPAIEPSATGHIAEQIMLCEAILKNGFAYEVNGSVYFDVKKYAEKYGYGQLSGRDIEALQAGTRTLDGQEDKRNALDFALWKKASPSHIMRWPSPWGEGFPGWHIECSAMSTKYLGINFDIHGGGMDLKFPHHECEMAQNTAATGSETSVKYWLHGNMLTLNGKKMSKSDGHFLLPGDLLSGNHPLLQKAYSPMAIRFFFLQAHYGSTLDMSEEALIAAEKGYKRLSSAFSKLESLKESQEGTFEVNAWKTRCLDAMNDDFNSPVLLANLFEASSEIQKIASGDQTISAQQLATLRQTFNAFYSDVLGLEPEESQGQESLKDLMSLILDIRTEAKTRKDWATADLVRNRLLEMGIQIKDGKEGSQWEWLN
jgi:cysteinyl-tRNA synthetase